MGPPVGASGSCGLSGRTEALAVPQSTMGSVGLPAPENVRRYWKREQPPPTTCTRRPWPVLFSAAMISFTFCFAFSVTCNMGTTSWRICAAFVSIEDLERGRLRRRGARGPRRCEVRLRARSGHQPGNDGMERVRRPRHQVRERDGLEEAHHFTLDAREPFEREAPAEGAVRSGRALAIDAAHEGDGTVDRLEDRGEANLLRGLRQL